MTYDLVKAHANYLKGIALTDTELRAWHKDLGFTMKKLWLMGYEKDALFVALGRCLKDALHMIESRKKAGKWNPAKRRAVDKIKK